MLLVVVVFFKPFLTNALTSNYAESYAFYNHDGKLYSLINFYSIPVLAICVLGFAKLIKKEWKLALTFLFMMILPLAMFWTVQSLERHHYYMITINILLIFIYGLYCLLTLKKSVFFITTAVLLVQAVCVFTASSQLPLITSIRKIPEVREDKEQITDLTMFLKSILVEDWQSAYIASGSSRFNDDILRNSILPDIDAPQIDSAVLDIRDGFPKDFQYISYFIVCDPIQYLNENYQHMYKIITDAIVNHSDFSKEFTKIYSTVIDGDIEVSIYEKTGEITPAMKEYFYKELISFYPDKTEYFSYILD